MGKIHNETAYQNQSPQNSKGFFQTVLLHFKFQMTKSNKYNIHISYHTIFIYRVFSTKTHIIMNSYYYKIKKKRGSNQWKSIHIFPTRLSNRFCSYISPCTTSAMLQSEMKEDFIVCLFTSSVNAYGRFGRRGRIMHKSQRKQYVTTAYLTGYTENKQPRSLSFPYL